jgi:hypothetical protein
MTVFCRLLAGTPPESGFIKQRRKAEMTTHTQEPRSTCRRQGVEFGAAYRLREERAFATAFVESCPYGTYWWLADEISRGYVAPFASCAVV